MILKAKSLLVVFLLALITFTLIGCNNTTEKTITEVSFDSSILAESYTIDDFSIDDYELTVSFSDGSTLNVPITENMISTSDLLKLSNTGVQTIEVLYQGFKVVITITLTGIDELTVLLMSIFETGVTAGSITEMTYEEWLESIRGDQGLPGTDGKEVTFRVSEGYIQWQYIGDLSWNNLVALSTLTGAAGADGTNGVDGQEVSFQVSGGYIQWQYVGDSSWTNLVELTSLVGPAGQDGVDGINGKEVTFRVSEGYIQWQYIGDLSWNNLVALSTLTGAAGADGTDGTDGLSAFETYLLYHPHYPYDEEQWISDLVKGNLVINLTYDLDGGNMNISNQTEYFVGDVIGTLPTPEKDYYNFVGWFVDGVQIDSSYVLIDDVNVIAHWEISAEAIPVSTLEDLIAINDNLDLTYILLNDIDLTGTEWIPIGDINSPFTGMFDGQGYTLTGLTITTAYDNVGLFGYNNGVIKNLIIENVNISVTNSPNVIISVGSFIGYNNGYVSNLNLQSGSVSAEIISGVDGYLGGLIGYNNYSFSPTEDYVFLQNNATINGTNTTSTGGLIGYTKGSLYLEDSSNSGAIIVIGNNVGGLVGRILSSSYIFTSENTGSISVTGNNVGGVFGYSTFVNISETTNIGSVSVDGNSVGGVGGYGRLFIYDSVNEGMITTTGDYAGGIIGYSTRSYFDRTSNTAVVTGDKYIGGISGIITGDYVTFDKVSNSGDIISNSIGGGLIGLVDTDNTTSIDNSYNTGLVSAFTAGGLVGNANHRIYIDKSYNSGTVSGQASTGGLIGNLGRYYGLTVSNSYNSGSISSGGNNVGGLVGSSTTSVSLNISDSYNIGNVAGVQYVGGICGMTTSSNIVNVYNTGQIVGSNYAGGMIGSGEHTYIYYSLNFGDVSVSTTDGYVGGIIGSVPSTGDYALVYYNATIRIDGDIVVGSDFGLKNTDLTLFTKSYFIDTLLWDSTTWDLDNIDILNGVYPTIIE